MSADDLVSRFREHQVTNLRACIDSMEWLECVGVPETNVTVRGTSTRRQEAILMR